MEYFLLVKCNKKEDSSFKKTFFYKPHPVAASVNNPEEYSEPCHAAVKYFRKTLYLRCLVGFWIYLCYPAISQDVQDKDLVKRNIVSYLLSFRTYFSKFVRQYGKFHMWLDLCWNCIMLQESRWYICWYSCMSARENNTSFRRFGEKQENFFIVYTNSS